MRTTFIVAWLAGLFLLFASAAEAEMRTWTRANGKQVEAEFVKRDGPVVTLRRADGTEMTVRMRGLSDEDREYVKKVSPAGPAAGKVPPDSPMRTWTRNNGKTVEARFVGVEHRTDQAGKPVNIVVLRQADGKTVTLRLGNSCERQGLSGQVAPCSRQGSALAHRSVPAAPASPEAQPQPPQPAPAKPETVPPAPARPEGEDKGKGRKTSVDSDELQERLDKIKDAEALLRRVLKGFPASCVTAQVVGTPKPVKQDDQKVTVRVRVKIGIDEKALASFRKRLLTVLEEFKEEGWDESWTFEQEKGRAEARKAPQRPIRNIPASRRRMPTRRPGRPLRTR